MRLAPILASLLLAGCASISGLTGYTFVDEEGDEAGGSAGASAGNGGASGLAGSSGTACAGPLSVDENYARACALAIACTSGQDPPSLSRCIEGQELSNFGNAAGCILTKSDCDGYFQCTGERRLDPTTCGTQGWSCKGDLATGCGSGIGLQLDCKQYGGVCRNSAQHPSGVALVYPCELPSEVTCSAASADLACSGDFAVQCAPGALDKAYGRTCANVGQCLQGACVTSALACTSPGGKCNGDKKVLCSKENLERSTDCAQAGLECVEEGGQAFCRASGCSAQDAASCKDRCEGSRAILCLGGATFELDCATMGAACTENFNGQNRVACSLFLRRARPRGPRL